ncbi:MAG: Rne/Rng family ribonuclease [Christensenellales bacterium]|jgi:ribonuclease G
MDKQLLIECSRAETRLCVLEDMKLAELYIERKGTEKLAGNIYVGRVENVLPGMNAAFVDIGQEKNGFLYADDIQIDARDFEGVSIELPIQKRLKRGQEIVVQVAKDAVGTKGARLSCNITLPGRLTVLLPSVAYTGVSRRIETESERARLKALADAICPSGMGLIFRTAAEGADEEELRRDVQYLVRLWENISRRGRHIVAPALLHADGDILSRAVRDMFLPDVTRVLIDDEAQAQVLREHAKMLSDELADRIEVYAKDVPMATLYGIESQVEKALSRKVWLKSGGYLVIDHAEALTAIDVNTGKFTGKTDLSDTVFRINCEAAEEIARQLRLRDIGGIIVIDFIDMDKAEQRENLLALFAAELKKDRTKTNLVGLTPLGLVEMTRKKVRQPLHSILKRPCPVCDGTGMTETDETKAITALRALKARLGQANAFLVETDKGTAGQMLLLGADRGVRAYVRAATDLRGEVFRIAPISEDALPQDAKLIPALS